MERSSEVILGVPFLSADFPASLFRRRRSKTQDTDAASISPIALYYLHVIFLICDEWILAKKKREICFRNARITIQIEIWATTRRRAFSMNETSRSPMVRDFPGIWEIRSATNLRTKSNYGYDRAKITLHDDTCVFLSVFSPTWNNSTTALAGLLRNLISHGELRRGSTSRDRRHL